MNKFATLIFILFNKLVPGHLHAPVPPIIGVDLGTAYSCAAIVRNGKFEIIGNEQGKRKTPSFVAFTDDGQRLIGEAAREQLTVNPNNTIFDAKLMLGRHFEDTHLQKSIKRWPFKIIKKNDLPFIQVNAGSEVKTFAPEEIIAMVLSKVKEYSEAYLKTNVTQAVVAWPAYFDNVQRSRTRMAFKIAGIELLRVIQEPCAAAIAFGQFINRTHGTNIFVFDLGARTFDVSVLVFETGVYEVLSTSGKMHLGGDDFDNRMIAFVIKKIKTAHRKVNKKDYQFIQRLRREVEKAKRTLSKENETKVEIQLSEGHFSIPISRAEFENLIHDLLMKTLGPMEECLLYSHLSKSSINEIILLGGSTKIPKVQQFVKEFFNGKEPNHGIKPDEAVAYGAAVLAENIRREQEAYEATLNDVNPLAIYIDVMGQIMRGYIARDTKISTKLTQVFETLSDNQQTVRISVFEGEGTTVEQKNFLAAFELENLPQLPKGQVQIEVTLIGEPNGVIHVIAEEKVSGQSIKKTITNYQRQSNQEGGESAPIEEL